MVVSEYDNGAVNTITTEKDRVIQINAISKKSVFEFDWVFPATSKQSQVYEKMCKPLVNRIFDGVNATVFAYGQTGSGKTYTMGNASNSLQGDGIILLSMQDIFRRKTDLEEIGVEVDVQLSYIEVYKEECYDLLSPNQSNEKNKVELRETSKGETILEGLTHLPVNDIYCVGKHLNEAAQYRTTSATNMNAQSSRSHAICTLSLRVTRPDEGSVFSKLHLVDLAGSERAKKTMATGDIFNEGVSINKSLFALGNVVAALAKGKTTTSQTHSNGTDSSTVEASSTNNTFIPYRESKLTRLLKDSLGGNGLTVMLACVSPADCNVEETINTLRFASRASSIVNTAKVNHADDNQHDKEELKKELSNLRQKLAALESKCSHQQNEITHLAQLSIPIPVPIPTSIPLITNSSSSASSVAISSSNQSLLQAAFVLTVSFKAILVTCLEEGVPLEDDDLEEIKGNISSILTDLAASDTFGTTSNEKENNMNVLNTIFEGGEDNNNISSSSDFSLSSESLDFLPPIVNLIDRLAALQEYLSKFIDNSPSSNDDECLEEEHGREVDVDVDLGVETTLTNYESVMQEYSQKAAMTEEGIQLKQQELNKITDITEKFEATISKLKSEINSLQHDKTNLTRLQNSSSSSSSSSSLSKVGGSTFGQRSSVAVSSAAAAAAEDAKAFDVKKELREKSKVLEEKLKELKQKENEYVRVLQQKERLSKEAEVLHKELDESKKKRTELMRKMKEDGSCHLAEKQKLQHAEIQSRRRELQAQASLQGLKTEFDMKEKVLKGQLAARERESKQLKLLVEKQAKAKAYKESMKPLLLTAGHHNNVNRSFANNNNNNQMGSSANGANNNNNNNAMLKFEIPNTRMSDLRTWLVQETDAQSLRFILNDEIQRETELRSKAARQLQTLRISKGDDSEALLSSSYEVKTLEEEVRRRSVKIAQKQGEIADLGSVVERKRFNSISDLKEAKYVMEWMFEKITREHAAQKKQLENKVNNQRTQIDTLKKTISSLQSVVNVHHNNNNNTADMPMPLTAHPGRSSLLFSEIPSKTKGATLKPLFNLLENGRSSIATAFKPRDKKTASASAIGAEDSARINANVDIIDMEAEDVDESSEEIDLDETFYADDDIDEDYNPEEESKASSKAKKTSKSQSASHRLALVNAHAHASDMSCSSNPNSSMENSFEESSPKITIHIPLDGRENEDVLPPVLKAMKKTGGAGNGNSNKRSRDLNALQGVLDDLTNMNNMQQPHDMGGLLAPPRTKTVYPNFTSSNENLNTSNVSSNLNTSSEPEITAAAAVVKPLSQYTVKELKKILSYHGLVVSGLKEDLQRRIIDHAHASLDMPLPDFMRRSNVILARGDPDGEDQPKRKKTLGTAMILLPLVDDDSFSL